MYDDGLARRASADVSLPADGSVAALPDGAVRPQPVLVLPNDEDLSYCKIRLDPRSWAAVTSSLGRLPDPLSRAVAWSGARDLVRDGELPPRRYVELAVRHLPAETDTSIAGHVLSYARWTIADRYLPPGHRDKTLADIADACNSMLSGPADGDGMNLVAARGLIDSARRPEDIATLRSWLDAGRLPAGPDLDSRLRWQILLRLAVLGVADPAEIDREDDRDGTAAGRLCAARCRAARPDEAAKRAAWTVMVDPGSESSYQRTAIAQGFWQADQAELLAGYIPRYFAALATHPDPDAARTLCQHGFPHLGVAADTRRPAERCLASETLTGSLRRLLADQVEDLGRSLNVRSGAPADGPR
jgi:aminopeptidase N